MVIDSSMGMSRVNTRDVQKEREGLTYAEWYQKYEKPRLDAITLEQRKINAASHYIGVVDDCARCVDCEIGAWNAWQQMCGAR